MRAVLCILLVFLVQACEQPPTWTAQINPPRCGEPNKEGVACIPKRADVVVVRSPAALAMLSEISASRWFAERDKILTLWEADLQLETYELAPRDAAVLVTYQEASIKTVLIFEQSALGTTRREAARI